MEPRALRRVAGGLLLALAGAGTWYYRYAGRRPVAAVASRRTPIVPSGIRIRVEVLNASTTRGLAARATTYLRDLGFDVVKYSGTDTRRDSVVVIDRTGHPEWAKLAASAFEGARVESRPDSTRYVDLTILVGATWRPPAEPFNP